MCFPCSRCLKNSRDDNLFGKIAVFMQEWEAVGSGGISLGAFRQKFVLYLMKILLGMKRVVSLVCMMACLFVGCDKAVIQVVEFTVASDVRMKVGRSENLFDVMFLYKEDPEQEKWYFLPVGDVKDFTFERGYEYRVRARVDKEPTTYSVTKIISKTQKVSEGMGSDDVYIVQMLVSPSTQVPEGATEPYYLWKPIDEDVEWTYWTPMSKVEGFEFHSGKEWRVMVEYIPVLGEDLKIVDYRYRVINAD